MTPLDESAPLIKKPHATTERLDKRAYALFFLHGIGTLLPWNFFTVANGYFRYKFQHDVAIRSRFENAISVGSQIPNLLGLITNLYLCKTGAVSRGTRAITCLVVTTVCFALTATFVKVETFAWTQGFYTVTIISIVINNFCIGVYQGTIFGIAGGVGSIYMLATIRGVAMGGLFTTFSNLISLGVSKSQTSSAFAFFSVATLVCAACIFAYLYMFRLPMIKSHFMKKKENKGIAETSLSLWRTFKQIYPEASCVCVLFAITTSVFPALVSDIDSVNKDNGSPWTSKYFTDLVCFLVFNGADFAGRLAAGYCQWLKPRSVALPLVTVLRIGFVPLFIMCNYQPRSHMPVYFVNDYAPVVINVFFGLSNGYLTSLCMMYGPQQVDDKDKETAGAIMQLFLTLGLSIGASLSYIVVAII